MSQKSQEPANPEPQGPVPPYEDRKQRGASDTPRPPEAGDTNIGGATGPRPPRETDEPDPGPSSLDEQTGASTESPSTTASGTGTTEEMKRGAEERGRSRGSSKAQDSGPTADEGAPDLQSGDQGG